MHGGGMRSGRNRAVDSVCVDSRTLADTVLGVIACAVWNRVSSMLAPGNRYARIRGSSVLKVAARLSEQRLVEEAQVDATKSSYSAKRAIAHLS